jgi:hypothetical protein
VMGLLGLACVEWSVRNMSWISAAQGIEITSH